MAEKPFYFPKESDTLNIKEEIAKYARNWPWFLITVVLFVGFSFFYLKYSTVLYETKGKIKILDESSKGIELPGDFSSLFESSKVNLENEMEVIKSSRLLEKVVTSLGLEIKYSEEGKIKSNELWYTPFRVVAIDSVSFLPDSGSYNISITSKGYSATNIQGKEWKIPSFSIDTVHEDLPFLIQAVDTSIVKSHIGKTFKVSFKSSKQAAINLSSSLGVAKVGKLSEILSLSITGANKHKSEAIINEVIRQFDRDGILDRQLVYQRTIDFVDESFASLTSELDSIENVKKGFKQENSLSDIKLDAEYTIVKKSNSDDSVLHTETQLEIANLLLETLKNQDKYKLLPPNIGLENAGINGLINEYNVVIFDYEKYAISAGNNNPVVLRLITKLKELKVNILNSVNAYKRQLQATLKRTRVVNTKTNNLFSGIPGKEQVLRSIERKQNIKEELYVILLQRRQEAAINMAVTSPSIKVVDYAITKPAPVYPRSKNTYLMALICGLVIPFGIFYLLFSIDSRVHSKEDIEAVSPKIPVIGEIPFVKNYDILETNDYNSVLSEAYRIFRTNTEYTLNAKSTTKNRDKGKIIYVTSTVKGEGKTFTAINLATSYAALNKRVLLIGADFRNPQIHNHIGKTKCSDGLSNYLKDDSLNYHDLRYNIDLNGFPLDILFSGNIAPSLEELLPNGRFERLLKTVKEEYDYIIVDTAPTILVTDTLLISNLADITVYVVRSRFTEKKLLNFSNELIKSKKLVNVCYALNGLMPSRLYGYNYNYGYNYGYHHNDQKGLGWFKKFLYSKFKR